MRPCAGAAACDTSGVRLLLLARHGQSLRNVEGVVNGDPTLDHGLSPEGILEAAALGRQLAGLELDAAVASRFPRARTTIELALQGRAVELEVDSDLDDIRVGELEGRTLEEYRSWKRAHRRDEPFPAGESLDDAARRYADAFERLAGRPEEVILAVCHEIPIRYAVNAAAGSDGLDGPLHDVANATPYLFDEAGLQRALERIRQLVGPAL
jgi:broad specificity phosphatase PhoE